MSHIVLHWAALNYIELERATLSCRVGNAWKRCILLYRNLHILLQWATVSYIEQPWSTLSYSELHWALFSIFKPCTRTIIFYTCVWRREQELIFFFNLVFQGVNRNSFYTRQTVMANSSPHLYHIGTNLSDVFLVCEFRYKATEVALDLLFLRGLFSTPAAVSFFSKHLFHVKDQWKEQRTQNKQRTTKFQSEIQYWLGKILLICKRPDIILKENRGFAFLARPIFNSSSCSLEAAAPVAAAPRPNWVCHTGPQLALGPV